MALAAPRLVVTAVASPRLFFCLAGVGFGLSLWSWLTHKPFSLGWLLVGGLAIGSGLVELSTASARFAGSLPLALSHSGPGLWLLFAGGLLLLLASSARLPWRSAVRHRRPLPLPWLETASRPISMRS